MRIFCIVLIMIFCSNNLVFGGETCDLHKKLLKSFCEWLTEPCFTINGNGNCKKQH